MEPFRGRGSMLALQVLTAVLMILEGAHGISVADLQPFGPVVGAPESIPLPQGNDVAAITFLIQNTLMFRGANISSITVRLLCERWYIIIIIPLL